MKRKKIYLALFLFLLGMLGMLSILTMDIPLPEDLVSILEKRFTPVQIKLLTLINPTVILMVAVLVGTLLYQKVNLSVPIVEKVVGIKQQSPKFPDIVIYGLLGGALAGLLLSILGLFRYISPTEFTLLNSSIRLTLAARFLYGGLTEEILMRFGLMTLMVWIGAKLFKSTQSYVYWTGIVLSAFIFAIGHFPVVKQVVENPSLILKAYVLIGNSVGGFVFGWLYWKKGLESAFLAHIFTHVVLVLAEKVFL